MARNRYEDGYNKWIDPKYWYHPTPMNVSILLIGGFLLLYSITWAVWLATILPWPPFPSS